MVRPFFALLLVALSGCKWPPFSREASPAVAQAADAGGTAEQPPPLEAQVANATAVEAGRLEQWADARRHADRAVAAAPGWAEPYFVRSGILVALAGDALPGELSRTPATAPDLTALLTSTEWQGRGRSPDVAGQSLRVHVNAKGWMALRFDDRAERVSFKVKEGVATARLSNGISIALRAVDGKPGVELVEHWISDDGTAGSARWELLPANPEKLPSAAPTPAPASAVHAPTGPLLRGAAQDLEQYLRLRPDAPDKETVLQAIAQLSLRADLVEGSGRP
jgi:hypothetical protein